MPVGGTGLCDQSCLELFGHAKLHHGGSYAVPLGGAFLL